MAERKTPYALARLRWAIREYPNRLHRAIQRTHWKSFAEFIINLLELFLILDFYEIVVNSIKKNTRGLSSVEKFLCHLVFGNAIPLDIIRIDEGARIGTRQTGIVYVSGFTINSWGPFSDAILIHELVHVWQYTRQGAAYIPRALQAQRCEMGYNYGGLEALRKCGELHQFNLEQQADIVMDYFLLLQGRLAQWAPDARSKDLPLYESFMEQIRSTGISS